MNYNLPFDIPPALFAAILAWSIIWKAIALWHSARRNQLAWFIALVIVNTAGILEIVYLLFFRKRRSYFS